MPLMALEDTELRETGGRDDERLTQEEGSRRRTTEAGTVNSTRSLTSSRIDVHDEYSGGSVPLMALEDTALREIGRARR